MSENADGLNMSNIKLNRQQLKFLAEEITKALSPTDNVIERSSHNHDLLQQQRSSVRQELIQLQRHVVDTHTRVTSFRTEVVARLDALHRALLGIQSHVAYMRKSELDQSTQQKYTMLLPLVGDSVPTKSGVFKNVDEYVPRSPFAQ